MASESSLYGRRSDSGAKSGEDEQLVFSNHASLSDHQIMAFGQKHSLNLNILTLKQLWDDPNSANLNCIIYSGSEPDEFNTVQEKTSKYLGKNVKKHKQSYTHHWMAVHGNQFFNSYQHKTDEQFKVNHDYFEFVQNYPDRLQQYDSNVCGEYSLCFLYYCNSHTIDNDDDIGQSFCDHMDFSLDRARNDTIVLDWYEKNK